jgi:peptide deformylase
MIYPIVKYGDPVLENPAESIGEFDTPELHKLIDDMFESMYAARGVGLAAPQIGIGKRIAVIDCSNGERPEEKIVIINPEIIKVEGGRMPQHSGVPRERHAGQARYRAGAKCERRNVRDDRRRSPGARVPA